MLAVASRRRVFRGSRRGACPTCGPDRGKEIGVVITAAAGKFLDRFAVLVKGGARGVGRHNDEAVGAFDDDSDVGVFVVVGLEPRTSDPGACP